MKILYSCLLFISLSYGKEIDFDALSKTKAQKSSVTLGFKDAAVANDKNIMKLQRKQVKPIVKALKSIAKHRSDYVMVNFESVCGLSGCSDKNLHISGGPGRFSPSYKGATSGAIHKGYNGRITGQYNWSAQVDKQICSGSFYLKEGTKNISLNTYSDCHDPYDHQY